MLIHVEAELFYSGVLVLNHETGLCASYVVTTVDICAAYGCPQFLVIYAILFSVSYGYFIENLVLIVFTD